MGDPDASPAAQPILEGLTAKLEEIQKVSGNPEDAVEPALEAVLAATRTTAGAICLFDPHHQVLRLAAERGLSDAGCRSLRHIRSGATGAWDMPLRSLENRRVYLIQDAAQNRYVPALIDDPKKMRWITCLPLFADALPVGSLVLISDRATSFSDRQVKTLQQQTRQIARLIETVRARATRRAAQARSVVPSRQGYRTAPQGAGTGAQGYAAGSLNVTDSERADERAAEWERKYQELAARFTETETALTAARDRLVALERERGELDVKLKAAASAPDEQRRATEDHSVEHEALIGELRNQLAADRSLFEGKVAELNAALADARDRERDLEGKRQDLTRELAATAAREHALESELRTATEKHDGRLAEVEERARRAETERQGELDRLRAQVQEAERGRDQLAGLAEERQELDDTGVSLQVRVTEAAKEVAEGERALAAEWQTKYQELEKEFRATAERERQLISAALKAEEEAAARTALAAGQSNREEARAAELQQLRGRMADVEAAAARDSTRADEWKRRHAQVVAQLEEAMAHRGALESELQALRDELASESAKASADTKGKAAQREELAAKLEEKQAAVAQAERVAHDWAERHEKLAAELATAVARAETAEQEVQALRADSARGRVEAESTLADAEQHTSQLIRDLEASRDAIARLESKVGELSGEVDARDRELATARQREQETQQRLEAREADAAALGEERRRVAELSAEVERLQKERERAAPTAKRASPPAQEAPKAAAGPAKAKPKPSPAPAPAAAAAAGPARALAIIDRSQAWTNVTVDGIQVSVLAPDRKLAGRLAEAPVDRVLVNLAVPGALDAVLALRAAGSQVLACGCLVSPGADSGLFLGFVDVVGVPLNPDDVVQRLQGHTERGTRVLAAGADADAIISLRQALSRQGMAVSVAWDSRQASDLLGMARPEIAVVDLDLPPRDGLDIVIELGATAGVRLLVLIPGRVDLPNSVLRTLVDPTLVQRQLPFDGLLKAAQTVGSAKG